ncbi:phage tail fiber protein [Enterobacter hormaechei]
MLSVGDFGVGSNAMNRISQDDRVGAGFYRSSMLLGGIGNGVSLIEVPYDLNTMYQLIIPTVLATKPKLYLRTLSSNDAYNGQLVEFYSTGNTTKASDGTLKAASPVARIVKTQEENQRTDIDEPGFFWCGCGTANAEAEGITISRLDVGVYVLTGSAGLASEGWQLLPPMDPGGMGELGIVEAERTESGGLTIRLFKRRYMLGDDGEIIKTKGKLMDVPTNSWIDVRLDMPTDSVFNRAQQRQ